MIEAYLVLTVVIIVMCLVINKLENRAMKKRASRRYYGKYT